jgi:hypothetical protein
MRCADDSILSDRYITPLVLVIRVISSSDGYVSGINPVGGFTTIAAGN